MASQLIIIALIGGAAYLAYESLTVTHKSEKDTMFPTYAYNPIKSKPVSRKTPGLILTPSGALVQPKSIPSFQ